MKSPGNRPDHRPTESQGDEKLDMLRKGDEASLKPRASALSVEIHNPLVLLPIPQIWFVRGPTSQSWFGVRSLGLHRPMAAGEWEAPSID